MALSFSDHVLINGRYVWADFQVSKQILRVISKFSSANTAIVAMGLVPVAH